jgi:hypothetical protein
MLMGKFLALQCPAKSKLYMGGQPIPALPTTILVRHETENERKSLGIANLTRTRFRLKNKGLFPYWLNAKTF